MQVKGRHYQLYDFVVQLRAQFSDGKLYNTLI